MAEGTEQPIAAAPAAPRYQPLVIVLAAACAGMVADRYWPLPVSLWWAAAAVSWIGWLLLWRSRQDRAAAVLLMVAVAAVAASWHHCRWQLFADDDLGGFAGRQQQPVCLEAIALRMPRPAPPPARNPMRVLRSSDLARVPVAAVAIRDGDCWRPISGQARLTVIGQLPGVRAGDRLLIFGQLSAPAPAANPGEFDFAQYLRGDRLRAELRSELAECVTVLGSDRSWGVRRLIEQTRNFSGRMLAEYLDHRRSALGRAVLLGERELIEPELSEAFLETGTIHILSISGLHVGMLAYTILWVMLRLPIRRGWAVSVVAGVTVFYTLLVEAEPPVVRSTVLVLAACAALYLGRQRLGMNTLAAAGLVVLAINPADLFRTGAQLSFLCVAGLIWAVPLCTASRHRADPLRWLLRESQPWLGRLVATAVKFFWDLTLCGGVLWLLTLPLVMDRYAILSPVALVLNTLVWLPIEVGLLSGFATVIFGGIWTPLGQLCGGVCNLSLGLLEWAVLGAREIPGSHFWVPGPDHWWLVGFYGALAAWGAFPRLRPPRRWCLGLLAVWATVGFGASWLRHSPSRLDCTFLAMGHGCAVVLELPSGQTVLYDAGRMGSPEPATRAIAAVLWSRGIRRLDAVVLSHADLDHYNALPGLLEKFRVGVVYVSPVMFENETPTLAALKEAIEQAGVPLRELRTGDRLPGGEGCWIEVLHPPRHGILGSDNANSVVLAVEYLDHRILLPGDLERPGTDSLFQEPPTPFDVVLVPHHGSGQSLSRELASWSKPRWAVVSGSDRWDVRPVRAVYEAAGGEVLHTAETGAIRVRIDPSGVEVTGHRQP